MSKSKYIPNVFGEMNNETKVVYFNSDLDNVPAFMCSPFDEGWFWSKSTKDLVQFVLEVIIPSYLVNDVMIFGDGEIEEDEIDFHNAVNFYRDNKDLSNELKDSLNELEEVYNNLSEVSYLEMIKLFCRLESICSTLGIMLMLETYYSPIEARHSENLRNEKFDFESLLDNFQ